MDPKDALETLLPPKVRAPFYAAFALIGVGLSATSVGFSAADLPIPVWLTVSLAVYAFLGTAFGIVALANTDTGADRGGVIVVEQGSITAQDLVEGSIVVEQGSITAQDLVEGSIVVEQGSITAQDLVEGSIGVNKIAGIDN